MPMQQRVIFFFVRLIILVAYITAIASALCWIDAPKKPPASINNTSIREVRPASPGWTFATCMFYIFALTSTVGWGGHSPSTE